MKPKRWIAGVLVVLMVAAQSAPIWAQEGRSTAQYIDQAKGFADAFWSRWNSEIKPTLRNGEPLSRAAKDLILDFHEHSRWLARHGADMRTFNRDLARLYEGGGEAAHFKPFTKSKKGVVRGVEDAGVATKRFGQDAVRKVKRTGQDAWRVAKRQTRDLGRLGHREGKDAIKDGKRHVENEARKTKRWGQDLWRSSKRKAQDGVRTAKRSGTDAVTSGKRWGNDTYRSSKRSVLDAYRMAGRKGQDAARSTKRRGFDAWRTSKRKAIDIADATRQKAGKTAKRSKATLKKAARGAHAPVSKAKASLKYDMKGGILTDVAITTGMSIYDKMSQGGTFSEGVDVAKDYITSPVFYIGDLLGGVTGAALGSMIPMPAVSGFFSASLARLPVLGGAMLLANLGAASVQLVQEGNFSIENLMGAVDFANLTGQIVGATLGTTLGTMFLPIPYLGPIIGGLVGGVLGAKVVKWLREKLGDPESEAAQASVTQEGTTGDALAKAGEPFTTALSESDPKPLADGSLEDLQAIRDGAYRDFLETADGPDKKDALDRFVASSEAYEAERVRGREVAQ